MLSARKNTRALNHIEVEEIMRTKAASPVVA